MEKFRNYLQEKHYKENTILEHVRTATAFLKWLSDENVKEAETSYNDVLGYVNHLQKRKVSASSINNRIRSIKLYFDYQKIVPNPAKGVKIKASRKNVITDKLGEEELNQIYKDYLLQDGDKRFPSIKLKYEVVLGLMIYQGCTATELKRIHIDDVNLIDGTIKLIETSRTKERIIKLEAVQILPLMKYLDSNTSEYLFSGIKNLVYNTIRSLNSKLDITLTNRLIRDSRILLWLNYYNISKVQYLCGFKYISSLDKYRFSEVEDLRIEIEKVIRIV